MASYRRLDCSQRDLKAHLNSSHNACDEKNTSSSQQFSPLALLEERKHVVREEVEDPQAWFQMRPELESHVSSEILAAGKKPSGSGASTLEPVV
jgi:hypothetical protein